MVPEQIEREVVIEAAPEKVWTAITEAEHVVKWFGEAGAEIDLRPGGAMRLEWLIEGKRHIGLAVVEKVDRPHLFSFRWARESGKQPTPGHSTLVEFTLTPEGAGTRLRVVESGWRELAVSEAEQAEAAAGNTEGWRSELGDLVAYLSSGA